MMRSLSSWRALWRRFAAGFVAAACIGAGLGCLPSRHPRPSLPSSGELAAEQGVAVDSARAPALDEPQRECLEKVGALAWHARGYRGQGVKVAVLDTGFRGYRSFLGKGLPSRVTTRSFRDDGQLEARPSQHGVLCAEIIHALAPEAEILLANWEPDRPGTFLQAVDWARRQGARVCSCSVIMPGWSDGHGGGTVHAGLAKLLGDGRRASDLLLCACAGNTAQRHWTGDVNPDADGWHCWQPGQRGNTLTPWGSERVAVELYGARLPEGSLQVIQRDSGRIVGQAPLGRSDDTLAAAIRFDPERGADYLVRLHLSQPARDSASFHLVVLGGNLRNARARDSIPFPGDGERVLTATAVDEDGGRKHYSSCGPTGARTKPDFAAIVPFPSRVREQPFSGTSAAAPQLAGLAALVLSRQPHWSPRDVYDLLQRASLDIAPAGLDPETGHGLARLQAP